MKENEKGVKMDKRCISYVFIMNVMEIERFFFFVIGIVSDV